MNRLDYIFDNMAANRSSLHNNDSTGSVPPVYQNSARKAVMKLSTSLESGKSDYSVATDYEHWQKHS